LINIIFFELVIFNALKNIIYLTYLLRNQLLQFI